MLWKVKRMNPARLIVLAIALGAGGIAAYLASSSEPTPAAQSPQPQLKTVDVLVAKSDIPLGQTVTADKLQWQTWPAATASTSFIRRDSRPDATKQIAGSIARSPFIAGEPVREAKLVKANGSGFMAAILPPGMRAISTEISPETGAGGFILPNDRVDVIMVRKGQEGSYLTETVLSNVRVLAIDQQIQENEDGSKAVVGTTATLELTPDQSKVMAVAQQMAERLSLALRSIADAQEADTGAADYLLSGGDGMPVIQVIKTGAIVSGDTSATQK